MDCFYSPVSLYVHFLYIEQQLTAMKIEAYSLSCERDTETYWGCIDMKTPFTFPNTGQKMKDLRGENQVWCLYLFYFL